MDTSPLPDPSTGRKRSAKTILIIIAIVVVAGIIAAIAYLFLLASKPVNHNNHNKTPTVVTEKPKAPNIRLALVATGLSNVTGMYSTHKSDDARLFVITRSGVIRILTPGSQTLERPFLDISSKVKDEGEMGLLGLAFAPDYAKSGKFYVNYVDKGENTVIAQYTVSSDKNVANADSGQTVMTFKQPFDNHNGGDLAFGKDGFLYIATGDGGSAGDPQNYAQNLNSLLGKILRIDVSQLPYKTPTTNPFVGQTGKKQEIWAYGLRNPWRISFDRKTQDLYIADVGQGKSEEVNVEVAGDKGGRNYGWRCYEGNAEFKTDGCAAKDTMTFPVVTYDHSGGNCSITGGYVYRGQLYPALNGKYFYGDYCGGQLYYAAQDSKKAWQQTAVIKTPYQISAFGEDGKGELYMADFAAGAIYTIEDANK